jgi:hypothetical protein
MAEPAALEVEFHGREFSDFDLIRIVRAAGQGFSEPVTAYLVSAQIVSGCAVGVVYGLDDVGAAWASQGWKFPQDFRDQIASERREVLGGHD